MAGYVTDARKRNATAEICVHEPVLKRRLAIGRNPHENNMVDFREAGDYCFVPRPDSATRFAQSISIGKSRVNVIDSSQSKSFGRRLSGQVWADTD